MNIKGGNDMIPKELTIELYQVDFEEVADTLTEPKGYEPLTLDTELDTKEWLALNQIH